MSSISGIGAGGGAWKPSAPPQGLQTRMFARVDTDSSGTVNAQELQTMLSDVSEKTGVSFQDSAQDLLTQMDQDGNGSLSKEELGQGMQSLLPPPPSTMAFAQARATAAATAGSADDLFGKVDSDGSGVLSQDEFQALMDRMQGGADTAASKGERFSALDSDGDGSLSQAEFEAGRPAGPPPGAGMGGPGGMGGAGPMMGPPPAPTSGTQSADSSASTSYDSADLNHDGTVSPMERLASALQEIAQTNSEGSGANPQIAQLAQSLYEQISTHWLQDDASSGLDASA